MNTELMFKSSCDNYSTPKDVYQKLNDEFQFNFDPCPLNPNPEIDGLSIEWGGATLLILHIPILVNGARRLIWKASRGK